MEFRHLGDTAFGIGVRLLPLLFTLPALLRTQSRVLPPATTLALRNCLAWLHVGCMDKALFLGEKHLHVLPCSSGWLVRLPEGRSPTFQGFQLLTVTFLPFVALSWLLGLLCSCRWHHCSQPSSQKWRLGHLPYIGESSAALPSFLIPPFSWGPLFLYPEHWLVSLLPAFPSSSLRYILLALPEHRSDFGTPWLRGSQWALVDHGIADSATWQLPSPPPQDGCHSFH